MNVLEEKFREAACIGDTEAILSILSQGIDVNSKNSINGWTALHWASKRGQEEIARILLSSGADRKIRNNKGETPGDICTNTNILQLLGEERTVLNTHNEDTSVGFTPNYVRNAPLNGQVDIPRSRSKHSQFSCLPTTNLPAMQDDDLVLKVRIANSWDPDFIEIEIPKWKLTYNNLLKICCEELCCSEADVERIRKLPNTRLRQDSDVKRLNYLQCLEIVLKPNLNKDTSNCYQSISTCKDQTILY